MPLLIGWVLDKYCQVLGDNGEFLYYDYTIPMIIFAGTGLLAIVFAFLLKAEDKRKRYGLELPNIAEKITQDMVQ